MKPRPKPIVLVEPNPDDVILTIRALGAQRAAEAPGTARKEDIGNEVMVISDGEGLLARLLPADGTSPLQPAIVLMDIQLPRISGLAVLERLRADDRTRHIPVIMLSTACEERDVVESHRLGADNVVCKPVVYNDFARIVQTLSAYWLEINEPRPTPEGMP
jgi:two-component system response regulator